MELGIQPSDCVGNRSSTCWAGVCVCVCVRVVSEREKEEEEKWPSISRLASSLRMRSAVSAICARRLRRMWWRRLAGEFQPGRVGHQAE